MHASRFESVHPSRRPAVTSPLIFRSPAAHDASPEAPGYHSFEFSGEAPSARQPNSLATQYAIRLARTPDHLKAAMRLMHERYQWRGYVTDPSSAPRGMTLMACEADRITATVTVGADSTTGLSVESLYADEVAQLRRDGARLCEFTRLAVENASHSMKLLGALFHAAYLCARRRHGATHLLVEVNPRHVAFYMRMLGFVVAGPQRTCERVNAPAVMLALSLDHAEEQIARFGGRPESVQARRSLYPFFFSAAAEDGILARLIGDERAERAPRWAGWPQGAYA